MPRVYVRKFDHDEARRRYRAGESGPALAREYGVTDSAIYFVVSPRASATHRRIHERIRARGRCERCGGWKNGLTDGRGIRLCKSCAYDDMATSVRPDELLCFKCREWKPDREFPSNRHEQGRRRGRASLCRPCQTIARQEYRERHKVPCSVCGKPALPPSEKRTGGASFPRCRECFHDWQRETRFKPGRRRAKPPTRAEASG